MTVRVRCPAPRCGDVFEVPRERLGRNIYCLSCGTRMTARPVEIDERLERKRAAVTGGSGLGVERLPLVAVVDNVRSLWNVGSIFRTADACGVRELALTGITGCPPRPEIAKTALGAEQAVRWSYAVEPLEAVTAFARAGFTPVAIEATPRAVELATMRWPARPCLVLGNEVAGVSEPALAACELHVRIPMRGTKDSLNVAVAFGIAAHAAAAALIQSNAHGQGEATEPGSGSRSREC